MRVQKGADAADLGLIQGIKQNAASHALPQIRLTSCWHQQGQQIEVQKHIMPQRSVQMKLLFSPVSSSQIVQMDLTVTESKCVPFHL